MAAQIDIVGGRFEACEAYAPDGATPVCAGCGWLADEHLHAEATAPVRRLPVAPRTPRPVRLAS